MVGPLLSLVTRPHRGRAPCPPQVSAKAGPRREAHGTRKVGDLNRAESKGQGSFPNTDSGSPPGMKVHKEGGAESRDSESAVEGVTLPGL